MQSKVVPRAFVLMTVLFYFKEEIMSYSVVWILFLGGCLFLMYFYSGKMRQVKKYQKQQRLSIVILQAKCLIKLLMKS